MSCECQEKPSGAPDDSVKNAAALWVASGKHSGFIEGAQWATLAIVEILDGPVAELLEKMPKKKAAAVTSLIKQRLQQIDAQLGARERDSKNMAQAAVAMADRLSSVAAATQHPPGIVARLRRGLAAFRA